MEEKRHCTECGVEIDHLGGLCDTCWEKKTDEINNIYVIKLHIGSEDDK